MPAFFANFPLVNYNGQMMRNIILKTNFIQDVIATYQAFYPYTIVDDMRADLVAFHYYGDNSYDYLCYLSNQIIDPYFQWPLTQSQFQDYITDKYGDVPTAQITTHHYEYNDDVNTSDNLAMYRANYSMTPTTWSFLSTNDKSYWTPVDCYTYEFGLNEDNRNIQLISNVYKDQITREISQIFQSL